MKRSILLVPLVFGAWALGSVSALALPAGYHNMYDDDHYSDCQDWGETDPGAGGHFCRTDNSSFTWGAQSSISAAGVDNIRDVMNGTFEATDLSVSRDNPPVLSGTSETDVYFIQHDFGSGSNVKGSTWCNDAASSLKCDQEYVWVDAATPSKKVICHEGGHSVGLTHGSDGWGGTVGDGNDDLECLQTPVGQITDPVLGSFNTGEINSAY